MTYTVTFQIYPSGPFGLPQDGTVVVPGGLSRFHGPTIDKATGMVTGHGTLPIYRTESNSVSISFTLPAALARIHDNYLFMTVNADTPTQALSDALAAAGLLMRLAWIPMDGYRANIQEDVYHGLRRHGPIMC